MPIPSSRARPSPAKSARKLTAGSTTSRIEEVRPQDLVALRDPGIEVVLGHAANSGRALRHTQSSFGPTRAARFAFCERQRSEVLHTLATITTRFRCHDWRCSGIEESSASGRDATCRSVLIWRPFQACMAPVLSLALAR